MIPTQSSSSGAVPGGAHCALHGDRAAEFTCSRCGNFACAECKHPGEGGASFCKACSEYAFGDIPMERIAELGFPTALYRTVLGVLFKPWEFFAQRSRDNSILIPLLFGVLIAVPNAVAYAVVNAITQRDQLELLRSNPVFQNNPVLDTEFFRFMLSPGGQLIGPVIGIFISPISLLIFAAFEWLAMFAVGAREASFRDVLRAICYLQATSLVMLVVSPVSLVLGLISPQLGGILFFPYLLYWVVWLVIALSKTTRTEIWRPVAAQGLLFTICCCVPVVLVFVLTFAAVGAALGSH